MKRFFAFFLAAAILCAVMSACNININVNVPTQATEVKATETETSAAATEIETDGIKPTEPQIGELSDYVKTYKENTVSYGDGNKNTLRIPEILIDSSDAKYANDEIYDRFYDALDGQHGMYQVDYEAYLNGSILSVLVLAKYEGGNTYALCFNFDVTTGKLLDNIALCQAAKLDYSDSIDDLGDSVEAYYEEKYATMPGNDNEKKKTLSEDNYKAAKLYLNGDGDLWAIVDIYAAVGGGHWSVQLEV